MEVNFLKRVPCARCKKETIAPLKTPIKAKVYKCHNCGNVRIWCPECNQGWVNPLKIISTGDIIFSCDECNSTWPQAVAISIDNIDENIPAHCFKCTKDEVQILTLNDNLEIID